MPEIYVQTNLLLLYTAKVAVLRSVQERQCEHPVKFLALSQNCLRRVCPSEWNTSAPTGRIFVKLFEDYSKLSY